MKAYYGNEPMLLTRSSCITLPGYKNIRALRNFSRQGDRLKAVLARTPASGLASQRQNCPSDRKKRKRHVPLIHRVIVQLTAGIDTRNLDHSTTRVRRDGFSATAGSLNGPLEFAFERPPETAALFGRVIHGRGTRWNSNL